MSQLSSTTASPPDKEETEKDSNPSTEPNVKTAFESDLKDVVASSRSAFDRKPKPAKPLPSCFFSLKRINDHKFQFDFQWCPNDGEKVVVSIHNKEKYPKAHEWDVEILPQGGNPHPRWAFLDDKRQWDGLTVRELLLSLSDAFWSKGLFRN